MVSPAPDGRIKRKKGVLDVLADVKDPQKFPWPIKSMSIMDLTCVGVFEYVPGKLRGKFMDQVYWVLTPEGKATFVVPHWQSTRAFQDYRYEWPPLCEQSFLYFNKGWREANNLKIDLKCDFDFTYGYSWEPTTAARSEEARAFNTKHYCNCIDAVQLVLTKAKKQTES